MFWVMIIVNIIFIFRGFIMVLGLKLWLGLGFKIGFWNYS